VGYRAFTAKTVVALFYLARLNQRQTKKLTWAIRAKTILKMKENMKPLSEAATYLGLSRSSLYKITANRKLRHFKPSGKLIFFNVSDLDEFLMRNSIETDDENLQEAKKSVATSANRQFKSGGRKS